MAITGAVAAAIRRDDPYGDWIAMGARLIGDPGGVRTGGRPYYWMNGQHYRRFKDIPGAVFSSAGQRLSQDADGFWRTYQANEPREVPGRGVDLFEQRTEPTINSQLDGFSVGATVNVTAPVSGGVYFEVVSGITAVCVGKGVERGLPYIDVRVQGVPTSSPHLQLRYVAGPLSPPAAQGEPWVNSIFMTLVGGDFTNVTSATLRMDEQDASPGWLNTLSSGDQRGAMIADGGRLSRRSLIAATTMAGIARIRGYVAFSGSGGAVDYTVRFAVPNCNKGAFLAAPILTGATGASAFADSAAILGVPQILTPPYTLLGVADLVSMDSRPRAMVSASDGTAANRAFVGRGGTNSGQLVVDAGGVAHPPVAVGGKAGARVLRLAGQMASTGISLACDGEFVGEAAVSLPAGLSRLDFGALSTGASPLNGAERHFAVFGPLSPTQMMRLTQ